MKKVLCSLFSVLSAVGVTGCNRELRTENRERVLRVCADPNNLPYSNSRQEGFENKIASLIARDLGARVEYSWWPQRRWRSAPS